MCSAPTSLRRRERIRAETRTVRRRREVYGTPRPVFRYPAGPRATPERVFVSLFGERQPRVRETQRTSLLAGTTATSFADVVFVILSEARDLLFVLTRRDSIGVALLLALTQSTLVLAQAGR